ncbi:two-component regulator propeller domain-containing protein [Flammeovirgaceae bacterium SG7u.111]|nr:two-component regulator propeller domain-containing protein [Flammeovirgaceae bacterium SG7u.132]WPO36054.1 two-component regulator propeller domain-containing protein [Flammeovirgaceae bacterium SG7u.111]
MKKHTHLLLQHLFLQVLLWLFGVVALSAQSSTLNFQKLSINGMGFDLDANFVMQDSIGYLWIGTNNGLYRYDGRSLDEFQYNVFDSVSLPNNSVNSIVEDDNGNLWIGTESYLVFYNRVANSFHGFYKNTTTKVLRKASDGTVWAYLQKIGYVVITPHVNLDSLQFATVQNYQNENKKLLENSRINSFYEDVYGRTWIATDSDILTVGETGLLSKTSFNEEVRFLEKYRGNSFLAFTTNAIYVLAYRKGNRKLEVLEKYSETLPQPFSPTAVQLDPEKPEYYVATKKGLIRLKIGDNGHVSYNCLFGNDALNPSFIITSLTLDNHKNLWIASSNGMYKMVDRGNIFNSISMAGGSSRIKALYRSRNKENTYVGTSEGKVIRFNSDVYSRPKFLLNIGTGNAINNIVAEYGTNEVLVSVNSTLFRSTNLESGNPLELEEVKGYKKRIEDVLSINQNEIWVGVWGDGVDIINKAVPLSKWKKNLIESLRGAHVSVLHLDKYNKLWIGTRGQGIYLVDLTNEKMTHIYPDKPEGLNSDAILCFLELGSELYIGTRGGGVNVYNLEANEFDRVYTKEEGLNSLTIASMEADKKGNIWMSTMHGITLFNIHTERFTNFGQSDGLSENQFTFNTSTSDESGNICFTDGASLVQVKTGEYRKNETLAKTLITGFEVMGTQSEDNEWVKPENKPIELGGRIELPYDKYTISIRFTSLDFTAPEKNKYAYKLEGVNDYWVDVQAGNSVASYNGLKPGAYVFQVKSSNSDGVWNLESASLEFEIKPPFWQTNIAILLYVLFMVSGACGAAVIIRNWYQMKKNLVAETVSRHKDNEHHQMKMIFFTDISHELRTPLTLIQGTIEKVIRENQYQLKENTARRIYNNSLRIGRLIDQIMDIRKNEVGAFQLKVGKGDIIKDILSIKNAFNDFALIYDITYEFESEEKELQGFYDPQIVEKVLFNLLSNAFKYTPEKGTVEVLLRRLKVEEDQLDENILKPGMYIECSVFDNGAGIPEESLPHIFNRYYQTTKIPAHKIPGTGIGMELVQKLVRAHGGMVRVDSVENEFSKFTFLLPIEKNHYDEKQLIDEDVERTPSILTRSEYQVFEEVTSSGVHKKVSVFEEKPKILLVDDNSELRLMLKEELFHEFEIIEAENGQIGYQKAVEVQPKLIISDILMPIEDGVAMLKKLKSNENLEHIPVFMLTAKDSQETKIDCLRLGAADYVEKPFSPDFLKWKVKNTLFSRESLKDKYSKVISVKTSDVELESNDEKLIKKLVLIVEGSLDNESLSVETLASEAGMSRANLYRKLQAILNESPVNFIKKIRLKRACQLLEKNNMYIAEVAYMTGFSNPKYFAKCFHKEFGISPTNYAKQFEKSTTDKGHISIELSDLFAKIG